MGKYSRAIEYIKPYIIYIIENGIKQDLHFAYILKILYICYSIEGQYKSAIEYAEKVRNIFNVILGQNTSYYIDVLFDISKFHSELSNYKEALTYVQDAKERQAEVGKDNNRYLNLLIHQAQIYKKINKHKFALDLYTEAIETYELLLDKDDLNYVSLLESQAIEYIQLGHYAEAILILNSVLDIRERLMKGTLDVGYIDSLNTLIFVNFTIKNYSEMIRLATRFQDKYAIQCSDSKEYATFLNNLAVYYKQIGRLEDAIIYNSHALQIRENIFGKKHPDYVNSLNNLSIDYWDCGNYDKAIELLSEILHVLDVEHPYFGLCLNNLANYGFSVKLYDEALTSNETAIELIDSNYGKNSPEYAEAIHLRCRILNM